MDTATSLAINWNTIILAVLALIGSLWGGWITMQQNKIHRAVNSTATAAEQEKERLNKVIQDLAAYAAKLEGPKDETTSVRKIMDEAAANKPANPNAVKS